MSLAQFDLTIEDGILLHLLHYSKFQDEFEAPCEITQPGIAEAIGIRRSHVSYVIKSLKVKGVVFEKIAHVRDLKRKRKIYFLTPNGVEYARKIRTNLEKRSDLDKHLTTRTTIMERNKGRSGVMIERETVNFVDDMATPTRFVGRSDELKRIDQWINARVPRIIVIKGIPGIGKTTLASRIVEISQLQGERDLFWYRFHEWDTLRSTLTDMGEFLWQIGKQKLKFYLDNESTIELPEVGKILKSDLEGLNAIMVFDDFQKIGKDLLQLFKIYVELTGPDKFKCLNIIILTRGATGFYGRREVAINKLIAEIELVGLDPDESKELLNLSNLEEPEFNKIFKITGGHPLSIELISIHLAKKMELQKINELTIELDIGELFKEKHDINKYVQEEIFQRLTPVEKKLLNRVAIFRYPIQPEAFFVEDDLDFECVDSLVDNSLLHETTSGYELHELIKEFFFRRLPPQLKAQYHTEAAKYYTSEFEVDNSMTRTDPVLSPMAILEAQHHYLQAKSYGDAARLLVKYGDVFIDNGYTEELMAILTELGPEKVPKDTWPQLLIQKGHILTVKGEWDNALKCYQDSLNCYESNGNDHGLARAYNAIGTIHFRKGDFQKAMDFFMKGMDFAKSGGDLQNSSKLYSNMALVHWGNGKLNKAIELNKKCLELSEQLEDKAGIARAHNNLGIIYWEQNKLDDAELEYTLALGISEDISDKRTIAILYDNLGEVFRLKGENDKAFDYYSKSLTLSEELDFKWQIAEVNCNLGLMYSEVDRKKSRKHLDTALKLYTAIGAKREIKKIKDILKDK